MCHCLFVHARSGQHIMTICKHVLAHVCMTYAAKPECALKAKLKAEQQ